MAERLTRWFTFSVAFSLLPFATSVVLRWLTGTFEWAALHGSPELLFCSLMVSAVALGDLFELNKRIGGDAPLQLLFSIFVIGVIGSAILYGAFVYDQIVTGPEVFSKKIFAMSVVIAIVYTSMGTCVQILLGKSEIER